MKKRFNFWGIILFLLLYPTFALALAPLPPITRKDRIIILAPHPDDAVLAASGVIQKALQKGAQIKVVYVTDGQHNIISLIFYKKFFLKGKSGAVNLGKVRKKESLKAAQVLGLKKDDLIFLNYPDSGILKIFLHHWGSQKPFRDSLTGLTSVEEKGISYHSLYKGENILQDLESIILKVKPTKIFAPAPFDKNLDHIGSGLFLELALLDLRNRFSNPELYLYLVHRKHISIFERYHPEFYIKFPTDLNAGYDWRILNLTRDEKLKKRKAILKFKTQMYCKKFLLSFDQDEIFEKASSPAILTPNKNLDDFFRKRDKVLAEWEISLRGELINFKIKFLKNVSLRDIKGKIYLCGYKRGKDFKDMPKVLLNFRGRRWNLYEQGRRLEKTKGTFLKINKEFCQFSIPESVLGFPDFIFLSIDVSPGFYNLYLPWRIIGLK